MAKLAALSGATADFTLPTEQVGGDQIIISMPSKAADIETQRNGVTISRRPWRVLRKWRVNYNSIAQTDVSSLRTYFELRVFKLYPLGAGLSYTVKWVEVEFLPDYLAPGYFKLSFTLEEVQT